jgi:hypothetical protein
LRPGAALPPPGSSLRAERGPGRNRRHDLMPRAALLFLPLLLLVPLSGCLTDPFGMKPEVPGVEIPAKPDPAEPAASREKDPS